MTYLFTYPNPNLNPLKVIVLVVDDLSVLPLNITFHDKA